LTSVRVVNVLAFTDQVAGDQVDYQAIAMGLVDPHRDFPPSMVKVEMGNIAQAHFIGAAGCVEYFRIGSEVISNFTRL
jgi:hypothetical protein